MNPRLQSVGRMRMSQIMEANAPHAREFDLSLEPVAEERWMYRLARGARKDQIAAALPGGGGASPLARVLMAP
jgi:hypothetical protein